MTQLVKAGTTSYREYYVRILDASTGAPYTGATSATAGASFGYQRPGGTRQSISLSDLSTIDAAYSSGGIKHVGSGWYRLDLPDAALASGVNSVTVDGAFTSYVVVNPKIQLVAVDLADAVRFGLTALPNAAAAASGGLLVYGTGTGAVNPASGKVPATIAAGDIAAGAIDAAAIATDAIGALELAAGAASEVATAVRTELTAELGRIDAAVSSRLASASYTAPLDAASTRAAVGLATANLDTQLTTIAGYIDTEVAAILAAVDTEVAAIKAKTDNLPSDPADQSQVEAAITAATTGLATASKLLKYVQLLARKDAAIATDNATELTAINANGGSGAGAFANTTDSQEALRDRGDAAWTTGAGADPTTIRDTVWGTTDGTRTVTQTGAQVADAIDGEDLTVHRGDTFSATLTGITIPTDWTKLVFTAKRGLSDADSASVVQIVLTNPSAGTDGLKYLEGAAPVSPVVAADAALTVPGLTSLTITMKPHATKELGIGSGWFYDVQADYGAASNSTTVCAGAFAVDADVTRATPS